MTNLLKLSKEFDALTTSDGRGKIIRNNDEILREISELEDFDDRVELAREEFEELGEGSSRTIFKMSDSLVLKVAHNDRGVAQNSAEMSMCGKCLNNVLAADTEAKWIIVRFSDQMTEEEFKDIIGFGFKSLMKALYWDFNNEIHEGKPEKYEEIVKVPIYRCLSKLVLDNQLQVGDIAKSSSWGIIDGRPVLRDFGLTKDVYADYYSDDEDNNTATV